MARPLGFGVGAGLCQSSGSSYRAAGYVPGGWYRAGSYGSAEGVALVLAPHEGLSPLLVLAAPSLSLLELVQPPRPSSVVGHDASLVQLRPPLGSLLPQRQQLVVQRQLLFCE